MKRFEITSLILVFCGLIAGCTNNGGVTYSGNAPGWYESSYTGPFNGIVEYGYYTIGAGSQGVFRSSNWGISWMPADSGLPGGNYNIAVAGNSLIATDNGPHGAFYSTDSGATWLPNNAGLPGLSVQQGEFPPITAIAGYGPDVFAGISGKGVYRATDPARAWVAANGGIANDTVYSFEFIGTHIFAGTDKGVYLSTDNGNTWTAVNNGLTANSYAPGSVPPIVSLAAGPTKIYAGSKYGDVFVTRNYGTIWTDISSGLPNEKGSAVSVAVRDSCLVAGNGKGVYATTNDGGSWSDITDNISTPGISALLTTGEFLYASANDSTVWRRPF